MYDSGWQRVSIMLCGFLISHSSDFHWHSTNSELRIAVARMGISGFTIGVGVPMFFIIGGTSYSFSCIPVLHKVDFSCQNLVKWTGLTPPC